MPCSALQVDPAWYIAKWTPEEEVLRQELVKNCKWSGKDKLSAKDHLDSMVKSAKVKRRENKANKIWNAKAKAFEAEVVALNRNLNTELQMNQNYADAHSDFDFDIAHYKRLRGGAILAAAASPVHSTLDRLCLDSILILPDVTCVYRQACHSHCRQEFWQS